jgi:hypothetical protein
MTVATAATIRTQLIAGTYPDDTLSEDNIYDYAQYEQRRKYPSCEVETVQPESTTETKRSTEVSTTYEIRYFVRNLGIRTDEIASQKLVEDVIMAQMESMTLQDHKVVLESKTWSRNQINKAPSHPAYTVSVLKVTVRQVTTTTATADGTLTFILANSNVANPPASNFTYTNVFDVDLKAGYRDVEEGYVGSNIPKHFAGHLTGNFICSIMVNSTDLGSTGEKLDEMTKLLSTGEKPTYQFTYVNKTADSSTITNTFTCEVESVQMKYSTRDGVVFQLIAKLITDVSVVIS